MSSLIPSADLTRESLAGFRCRIMEAVTALALRHGVANEASHLVIREGLPRRDFGLETGWKTPPLQAGTRYPFVTARLEQAATLFYWMVLGSADPAVGEIEFRAGDYLLARLSLEPLYTKAAATAGPRGAFWAALFSEPVVYSPHQQIRILVEARRSRPEGERISLGSLIAEPLSPPLKLVPPYLPRPLRQFPHIEEVAWQELALELGEEAAGALRQGGAYVFRGSNGHHYAVDGSGTLFNLTRGRQYCLVLDKDEELPLADLVLAKVRWCSKDAEHVEAVKNEVGGLGLLGGVPLYYGPGTEERQRFDQRPTVSKALWRGLEALMRFQLQRKGWRQ